MQLFECLLWILGMMVMVMMLSMDQACTSATLSSDFEASVVLYLTVIFVDSMHCWLWRGLCCWLPDCMTRYAAAGCVAIGEAAGSMTGLCCWLLGLLCHLQMVPSTILFVRADTLASPPRSHLLGQILQACRWQSLPS